MIYILIFVLSQYQKPTAGQSVEFNSLAACQAAAAELSKEIVHNSGFEAPVLFCAAKGEKK